MKEPEYFRCNSTEDVQTGCWNWTRTIDRLGYGKYRDGSMVGAHRGAWAAVNGKVPPKKCVCHICDNRRCVNPDHLFLGTHAENMADMRAKGRANPPKGERHPSAKLSERDVSIIKWCLDAGVRANKLAELYGVSKGAIGFIARGEHWKDVRPIEYAP